VTSTRLSGSRTYGFGIAWRLHNALGWKAHGDGGAEVDFALQIQVSTMHLDK
jgi:hypothetical protein